MIELHPRQRNGQSVVRIGWPCLGFSILSLSSTEADRALAAGERSSLENLVSGRYVQFLEAAEFVESTAS